MIVHIPTERLEEETLRRLCVEHYATYYRNADHYVMVLGARYKEVPSALTPYVSRQVVRETDIQLSSKAYRSEVRGFALRDLTIGPPYTVLAAGPCSVESVAQIEEVAAYLHGLGVRLLRAGCYKPRTSPYSFQGLGLEGLQLLAKMRERYGMSIITEVRDATHVDEVIAYSDIVQIGAKAMYDQGILRACGRARKPVLLKRGFGSSLQEFVQATEFILSAGNEEVILCERGIRSFESKTRFTLDLCGVAYLKEHVNLPIFIDPSHAMGYAYGVADLARAAVAMGVEGLLVEVHPRPQEALSDAQQQLDFKQFKTLHQSLLPVVTAVGRKLI